MCQDFKEKFFKHEKLMQIPKKEKYRTAIMNYIITYFEIDKIYNEKEVNEIIKEIYDDFAYIRRYLVDNNYLIRDNDGKNYFRNKDLIIE